ncbi:MAG: TRAP transporter substrate-binding protein [Gemmobacter sp.]|nr:TRAP transporter substrate-binding protein [Gemmobacter sp.]
MKFNLLIAVGTVAIAASTAVSAQEYKWDMPNTFGRTSSDGVADVLFGELVKEKTGGRIEITHHFDGSLGYRGADILSVVEDGAAPIARHATSYYGGSDPVFLVSTLPFLIKKPADVQTMHEVSLPYIKDAFLAFNQVVVSAGLFPPSGLWSREPITTLADLQGVKLRAFDLNSLETFSASGAAAINMNWGDVIPGLSTGVIDAVVTSADLGASSGLNDYTPNFLEINWAVPMSYVTVNKDVWDALPADLQAAVMEAGEETTARTIARLQTQVADNYTTLRDRGATVSETPGDDLMASLRASADPVIQRWRTASGDRAKVLDEYLAASGN